MCCAFKGYHLGLLICEDIWINEPIDALKQAGADLVLSINVSPYSREKPHIRTQLIKEHCQRTHLPVVYLNQIGGQDELVLMDVLKSLMNEEQSPIV